MSLFGALSSGVSGLTAQSSAIGAIADNISNLSTVGYKSTTVNFQTLVTKQTSSTLFSPGGVQSAPRQNNGQQGLLQASSSQSDLSLSGAGFFVVNEAAEPTATDQYLYTRAGSFFQDSGGFLRNTAGFYLQGWPTNALGVVIPANTSLTVANQNIISTDYLSTINLSRVGGTAAATSSLSIGANLPANDATGATHRTDTQFFDSLGNANTMSLVYTKSGVDNQWAIGMEPPPETTVLTLYDGATTPLVYSSNGQLEFTARPADGSSVVIDGVTYEFDSDATVAGGSVAVDISSSTTMAGDVTALINTVTTGANADTDFFGNSRMALKTGVSSTILFKEDGTGSISVNPVGLLDTSGNPVTNQTAAFTVALVNDAYTDFTQFMFSGVPADTQTISINGITYTFDAAEVANDNDLNIRIDSVANMLADLEAAIEANDPEFASGASTVAIAERSGTGAPVTANTLMLSSLDSGSYNVVFGAAFTNPPTSPDGATTYAAAQTVAITTNAGLAFDGNGLPTTFNVAEIEILGFTNGAEDMDNAPTNKPRIDLDFGTAGEADGMTQFGASFTPIFITQNGSRFGTFSGVTIGVDGLLTALFDNGETRPIFQIPVATFVNPNQLASKSGNVWSATQSSGTFTLRVADTGPAGQIVQGALEASTVDIGNEFTSMIVVQRAYAATAKIISTADDMLEELMRIKR